MTSPPFLDVVDYAGDNWLRVWFAGIDAAAVKIDRHKDIASWEAFVRLAFREFARVVRPGGFVAFEVGEVRGGVLLERYVASAIKGLPFDVSGRDGEPAGIHQDRELLGREQQQQRHEYQPDRHGRAAVRAGRNQLLMGNAPSGYKC